MKRIITVFLCLLCLTGSAAASEEEYLVALTFDDGPSGRFTRRLLDGLEQRNVPATFLLCGYRIAQYPKETARIIEEGHEIGLHGYSHAPMNLMDRRRLQKELQDTLALLPKDCPVAFLRPPGGTLNAQVRAVAAENGLAILSWSVDPRDWEVRDAAAIERSVVDRVEDGDVILLHDMSDSSVQAALDIVDQLRERGFQFVTASELARLRGRKLHPGTQYRSFPPGEEG